MGKRTRDGMGKRITNTYPLGTSDPLARRWWCDDHIQLQIPCSWFPSSRCCCLFSSLLFSILLLLLLLLVLFVCSSRSYFQTRQCLETLIPRHHTPNWPHRGPFPFCPLSTEKDMTQVMPSCVFCTACMIPTIVTHAQNERPPPPTKQQSCSPPPLLSSQTLVLQKRGNPLQKSAMSTTPVRETRSPHSG